MFQQDFVDIADAQTFHPDNKIKPEHERNYLSTHLLLMNGELDRLEVNFKKVVSHIPPSQSNDARALLVLHDALVVEMCNAWFKRYKVLGSLTDAPFVRPEWLKGHVHALPGGSLVIREDDPSSIIAHTLS